MEIIKANVAHERTLKAIAAKRERTLDMIYTYILSTISSGKFELNYTIDSPIMQDELFDYFTSRGYTVKFMPNEKNGKKYYDPDSRIMNISWEDATNE